jgi:hypothetical protein
MGRGGGGRRGAGAQLLGQGSGVTVQPGRGYAKPKAIQDSGFPGLWHRWHNYGSRPHAHHDPYSTSAVYLLCCAV